MQGAMEVDEEEQGIVIKEALKADSVAVLLGQALQAQDRALLERYAAAFQAEYLPMTTRLAVACKHPALGEEAIIVTSASSQWQHNTQPVTPTRPHTSIDLVCVGSHVVRMSI